MNAKPIISLIFLLGCFYFPTYAIHLSKPHHPDEKHNAEWAMKQIRSLPEVKDFLSTTPRSSKPDVMLSGEPDKEFKYYSLQIGISNLDIFRTSFYLYIDPKTSQIFYWDQLCEDEGRYLITLQQWRYWRTKPGWQKPQTYKNGKLIVSKK